MNTESVSLILGKYLYKQVIIAGIFSAIGTGIALLSLMGGIIIALSNVPKMEDEFLSKWGMVMIGLFIISFIALICSIGNDITFLAQFNPDYYAVKMLLSMLKP